MDTTKTYKDDAMCEDPETYENATTAATYMQQSTDDAIETYENATTAATYMQQSIDDAIETYENAATDMQQSIDDAIETYENATTATTDMQQSIDDAIETYENATTDMQQSTDDAIETYENATTICERTFNEFVAKKLQESIEENYRNIIECMDGTSAEKKRERKELCARVETFRAKLPQHAKMTVSVDFILEKIRSGDPMICAMFCKDPVKQTFHEKVQMAWIKQRQYFDVEKSTGICLSQGKRISISKTCHRPSDATKTFDAFVPSKKIYLILKYTTGAGGAQDNQFADVKNFCKEAVSYIRTNVFAVESFAFYLDGTYYTAKKIEILQNLIPDDMKARIVLTKCASI